jgi:23S rRNA (uracil747-C5)-methyltransferase
MNTFCSYFNEGMCRSCDLIALDYSDQITLKENKLRETLQDFKLPNLLPTVRSKNTDFRNKAKFIVTGTTDDPRIGLADVIDLDKGVDLSECSLHLQNITDILPAIKRFIKKANLTPYQIKSQKGELKGIILFHSEGTKQTYLRFVLRSKESIDRIKKFHQELLTVHNHLACISVNIQPISHAILEGEEEIFITEKTSISHRLGNIEFDLNPRAFIQTNQVVAAKLYETSALWIKEASVTRMLELYCGQGAFSFFAASFVNESLGVEINPQAVAVANQTAKKYKFSNLAFKTSDASKIEKELLAFDPDLILVNPPRRGLGETVHLLMQERSQRLIYSSCHAETLCEDLKTLCEIYEIKRVQLFDMFPNTHHYETLVELQLR